MSKKEKDEGEINSVEIDTMAHKWSFFFLLVLSPQ